VKKVGVNCFVEDDEDREIELHPHREEEVEKQIARLNRVRRERDAVAVTAALARARSAAAGNENVMPSVMDAVEAYATVGEVCGVFREVFGSYNERVVF